MDLMRQKHSKHIPSILFLALLFTAAFSTISPAVVHAEDVQVVSAPAPSPAASQVTQPASLVFEKQYLSISLQNGSKYASVNGKRTSFEASSYISGNQLMAPVKSLSQALGAKYEYSSKTQTAVISRYQTRIVLKAGSPYANVNNKRITLSVPVSSKTPLSAPARFISEALGAGYSWDEKSKTASISLKDKFLSFPDKELEKAVRSALKKPVGDLSLSDLKKVMSISAVDSSISNLNGIQYLTELGSIYISGSKISDISFLRTLNKLYSVSITSSCITDPSPLSSVSGIMLIDLSDNCIKDAASLKGLKKLRFLNLSGNFITDPLPLLELPAATEINLWDNAKREDLKTIYRVAGDIVNKVVKPGMSELDKELALHDYLVTSVRYDNVNFEKNTVPEESHHPLAVFTKGVGVCDGYSEAMQILLSMAGIECRVVLGDITGPGGTGHAWNLVKIDGEYYHVDVTHNDPVSLDSSDILSHRYFNLSDRQIALNHKWDRKQYPACKKDNPEFESELKRLKDCVTDNGGTYVINNNRLYRISTGGSYKKLCEDKVSCLNMSGGWLYFINLDDSEKVYRIRPDGKDYSKVSDYPAYFLTVENDIIYIISGNYIYKLNTKSASSVSLVKDDVLSYLWPAGDWIYFKAFNWNTGAGLYRVKNDGSDKALLLNEKPAGFNITNSGTSVKYSNEVNEIYADGFIYFINESDSNKLYRSTLEGSSSEKLCDDIISGNDIEIASGWIYYRNANDGNKYYKVRPDGSDRQLAGI